MKQTLIAFDQLLNTLVPAPLEGTGMADETISARAWRLRGSKSSYFWRNLYRFIDGFFSLVFGDHEHCYFSYISEFERKQLPSHYSSASSI